MECHKPAYDDERRRHELDEDKGCHASAPREGNAHHLALESRDDDDNSRQPDRS